MKPIISPDPPPPPPPGAKPREELPTLPEDDDAPTPRAPVERPSKPPHAPSQQAGGKQRLPPRPPKPEIIDRAPPDRRPGRNRAGILGAGIVLLTR